MRADQVTLRMSSYNPIITKPCILKNPNRRSFGITRPIRMVYTGNLAEQLINGVIRSSAIFLYGFLSILHS